MGGGKRIEKPRARGSPNAINREAFRLFVEEMVKGKIGTFVEETGLPDHILYFDVEQLDEETTVLLKYSKDDSRQFRVLHVTSDEFVYNSTTFPAFLAKFALHGRALVLLEGVLDRLQSLQHTANDKSLISAAQLEEALFELSFNHGIDHQFTDRPAQSLAHLTALFQAFARRARRGFGFAFDAPRVQGDSKTRLLGVEEDCSRLFVRILSVVPGMSEERAAGIAHRYPTLARLYKAFETAGENAPKLLETIEWRCIAERDLPSSKRVLGPALARRVHAFLTSQIADEIL